MYIYIYIYIQYTYIRSGSALSELDPPAYRLRTNGHADPSARGPAASLRREFAAVCL